MTQALHSIRIRRRAAACPHLADKTPAHAHAPDGAFDWWQTPSCFAHSDTLNAPPGYRMCSAGDRDHLVIDSAADPIPVNNVRTGV
jgi:hypothetical protein